MLYWIAVISFAVLGTLGALHYYTYIILTHYEVHPEVRRPHLWAGIAFMVAALFPLVVALILI